MEKTIKSTIFSILILSTSSLHAVDLSSDERSKNIADQKRELAYSLSKNYQTIKPDVLNSTSRYDLTIKSNEWTLDKRQWQNLQQSKLVTL